MGGAVNSEPSTHANDTVVMLQQATQSGLPVLIPGAFERRAGHAPARATDVIADTVTARPRVTDIVDRARLEREREGGGAVSQRSAGRDRTILARLWRRVFRGADAAGVADVRSLTGWS